MRDQKLEATDYAEDAVEAVNLVNRYYGYLDRFADGVFPMSSILRREQRAVHDYASLLRFIERLLLLLADHHAVSRQSFKDSWALVPTMADMWIERRNGLYHVDAVREGSPAEMSEVRAGDRCVAVADVPIADAVAAFWHDLGIAHADDERCSFAARHLVAGRRNQDRRLTLSDGKNDRDLSLPSLHCDSEPSKPPLSVAVIESETWIRFHNALMDDATITAFDAAMADVPAGRAVALDLTDTPSGGDTVIARAIMGWFIDESTPYQIHKHPAEERATGIPRQWVEQVLPRPGKYHAGPVRVQVGRWTGSLGEGIALAMRCMGHKVGGGNMAGLRGAIYNFKLTKSGLGFALPVERLYAPDGTPRECAVIDNEVFTTPQYPRDIS